MCILYILLYYNYFPSEFMHPAGHKLPDNKRFSQASWRYHWMLAVITPQAIFWNILKNCCVGDQDGDSWQFGALVSDWEVDVFRPDLTHKLYFKIDVSRP